MSKKNKGKTSLFPTLLTLFSGFIAPILRDLNHNKNIKRIDKTAEKVEVCEHLLVKSEKKQNELRKIVEDLRLKLYISFAVQAFLLLLILLKVFQVF
ncbi:MAG: hypothetical protein P9L91_07075 [Candidatus Zophobacter franzmannii]|nr:hypothetical protein [Candidatus Zophobacter franzmannii]